VVHSHKNGGTSPKTMIQIPARPDWQEAVPPAFTEVYKVISTQGTSGEEAGPKL